MDVHHGEQADMRLRERNQRMSEVVAGGVVGIFIGDTSCKMNEVSLELVFLVWLERADLQCVGYRVETHCVNR